MTHDHDPAAFPTVTPRLVLGIGIILIGVAFTLDNFGIIEAGRIWHYWSLILVAAGFSKLSQPSPGAKLWGGVLVAAGTVILVNNLGLARIPIRKLFPLVFVAIGIALVRTALGRGRRATALSGGDDSSVVSGFAMFGGYDRTITTKAFRGGTLTAAFGGWDVDLRQAEIEGDRAEIDVFVMFGGGDIRVPEHWDVAVTALPLFGGSSDNTRHPEPVDGRAPKKLVISGLMMFGGVEIKN